MSQFSTTPEQFVEIPISDRDPQTQNEVCYIIKPFSPDVWDVAAAVRDAARAIGLVPNDLDLGSNFLIIPSGASVRNARVIVAILHDRNDRCANPNVTYALGLAHALGKPTLIITNMDLGSLPTINNVPCIPLPSKDQIMDNTFFYQTSRSLRTLLDKEYKNIVWESAHLRVDPSVPKQLLGDSEHKYLAILESGTSTWNRWRAASEDVLLDFSGANLSYLDLHGANLQSANLHKVKFTQTDLRQASLVDSNLSGVDLAGANLTEADLRGATLYDAILTNTNLERTVFGGTILASIDLRTASGLDLCIHQGPSAIDFATLSKSGNISKQFLLGAGLPHDLIEYLPALLESAIHYYSCFLSYATANEDFARRLHADLQSLGIRSWYAPHELRLGERLWDQLDEAIRVHDKLVLVLSSESIRSGWVQREVEKVLSIERETHKTVLFPVLVDDTVFKTSGSWASAVKDRMMADFRDWREERSYTQALSRLVKALTVTAATETLERA